MPLSEMSFRDGALATEQEAYLYKKVSDLIVREVKHLQHYSWVILHEVFEEHWLVDRPTLPALKTRLLAEMK